MSATQRLSRSASGVRMGDMRAVQDAAASLVNRDTQYGLTALASGLQAGATQINTGHNAFDTVVGANDSGQLPAASPGSTCYVANNGAQTLTVFGKSGRTDTINGTAGATGVDQATGVHAVYFCAEEGKWSRILSA